ncbi:hypothetical protein CH267_02060 [Rhodococcus sp. 06-621-2]|nr:hypothetical protein [Rhodococcus sp. 06-621-2]OZC62343.1 hypothetical protein CH267_02060 [Rhodococcus sp. 06-621-2]
MNAGEVALQIGRALWITRIHETMRNIVYSLFDALGLPWTPEFQAQIDGILLPLKTIGREHD